MRRTQQRYIKTDRVRTRKEIVRLQNLGKKIHTKNFIIVYQRSKSNRSRFVVTVSKRVDKRAVIRNRLKRQLRELYRLYMEEFVDPVDLLVIARQSAIGCPFLEIKRQIIGSLRHHKIMRGNKNIE